MEDSVHEVPTAQSIPETSDTVGQLADIGQYQSGADDMVDGIISGVVNDDRSQDNDITSNVQSQLPVPSGSMLQPTVGRPKRDRRPNVKYSAEEYDLAKLSASKKGLLLSGLYVKQGRPKDKGRC